MDAERKERQKSICAARDWLSGAADAIAGEDDLAGDLKVMLARAELSRLAAARKRRLHRALRWIAAPLAAAGLWAAAAWGSAPPAERVQAVPAPTPASPGVEQRIETRAPAAVFVPEEQVTIAATPADTAQRAAREETSPAPKEAYARSAAPPQEARIDVPPQEMRTPRGNETIPTRDMQRLMQVGGKILRE